MKKIAEFICKYKVLVVVISFLLLVPALIGMHNTKVNYDILVYLPSDIETIKGEEILTDDFNMGAFSVAVIDNMSSYDMLKLEDKIKEIEGVEKVVSIADLSGTTIPLEMLPKDVVSKFKNGDTSLMLITFKDSTSDDVTLNAVDQIRKMTDDSVKLGGMSSMVLDTMELSDSEITIYIVIAVLLCIVVLSLALDSYIVPILLLLNIGIDILYNMGTNILLGDISYITKAISSVLQLGVTTDFSIFLYHKYMDEKKKNKDKNKAMTNAILETMTSVIGSSLTTMAGFLALCTMSLTLGKDIGIVMAKGVFLGVVCVLIVFPALLLVFDKQIEKTKHKEIIPKFIHLNDFIVKHYKKIFIVFLILLIPAYFGYKKTNVYYKLDKSLPETLESSIANKSLKEDFNIVSAEMIIIDKDVKPNKVNKMIDEIKDIDGIDMVLSGSKLNEYGINTDLLDDDITSIYKSDKYQMILVNSIYDTATDELNNQITKVNKIVKKYDKNGILAGEGPLMKDLVVTSDTDFHNVNYTSLAVIFIIMILVLKSSTLPIILIFVIEFAIFVNMGIPYYTDVTIPFIASIVIGTIQLGATIDYAILLTTKYLSERKSGKEKLVAIKNSLDSSVNSIFVSGMCFFAATFGVGLYSKLDMISSLCTLISRGALISMLVVVLVLPSFLILFDKLIIKTTKGFKKEGKKNMKKGIKKLAALTLLVSLFATTDVSALTKNETVFSRLDYTGKVKETTVNEHLTNINSEDEMIDDLTDLKDILNINGEEKFTVSGNKVSFENKGNEIYYSGKSSKELPVSMNISYKLDGEDINLKKLLGKSGRVEIKIVYSNNSSNVVNVNGVNKTLYTPFVVTMGTIIPTKNVSNVEVTNGRVTSTGSNNVVLAIAAPGLSKSLNMNKLDSLNSVTISYDVKDFKLNQIYSVVSTKMLDNSDLEVFDKLDDVYNKANTLSEASKQLASGTEQLYNGTLKLQNGLNENINSNSKTLSDEQQAKILNSALQTLQSKFTDEYKDSIGKQAVAVLNSQPEMASQISLLNASGNTIVINNTNTPLDGTTLDQLATICQSEQASVAPYSTICVNNADNINKYATSKAMIKKMQEIAYTTAINTAELTAQTTTELLVPTLSEQVASNVKIETLKTISNNITTLVEGAPLLPIWVLV